MKVALAFQNDVIADVYALALDGCLENCTVDNFDSFDSLTETVQKEPYACIVTDVSLQGQNFVETFKDPGFCALSIPIFVVGGEEGLAPPAGSKLKISALPKGVTIRDFAETIIEALSKDFTAKDFCKISVMTLLVKQKDLRFNLYVKLSDDKYIKVLNARDTFDEEQYKRFQEKKMDFLYLRRPDFFSLIDNLLGEVQKLYAADEALPVDASFSTTKAIFQTVHSAFETEGFTPEMRLLTEATINLAIKTVQKNPRLSELLQKMDADKSSFVGWHSTALSFLSCKLATMLGWNSEATFFKLSLASMLHDLSLPSDQLAELQTQEDLNESSLSPEDKELVRQHPRNSAKLISGFEEIPGEVSFIIEQHHERPEGNGFPAQADHKEISAISALFIITHDIVNTMFHSPPQNFDLQAFLTDREAKKTYSKGAFGQVFRTIMMKSSAET